MKKVVFIFLFLAGGLACAFAQQSGTCGENLTWTLDEDGTLTISGTGPMSDFSPENRPWGKEITRLILEEGITYIGRCAFYNCERLTGTLTLPAGLTNIGEAAFSGCSGFTGSLTLPAGLTSIGSDAFWGCSGFTGTLTLPAGLTSIGGYVFQFCSGFTGTLTLPAGLTSIGSGTFLGCSGFTGTLTLPAGLTSIGSSAFYGCSGFTGTLTLPAGLTSIGSSAFWGCSGFTGTLTLPVDLTSIESDAFRACRGFTGSLTLPVGLTSIGSAAFADCNGIDTLVLFENLLAIGSQAFVNCDFSAVLNENKTPIVIAADVFQNLPLSDIKLCVPAGSKTAYSQAEVWKEFSIEEYGVGITPSFSESGKTVDCGTEISISTKAGAELYYGLGKDAVPTLRYTSPIAVTDTTYISACSRVRNVYSDTVRATYIPEHASSFVDWDWSAEHKATLSLTCPRCKTEIRPAVSLTEELTKEATEEEAGLKTYTATATANEVMYKSTNREILARLKTDTVIVTDTVYIQVSGNTVDETMRVKLYPNPTKGSFTVEAEDASWMQIYNAAGACIQSNRLQGGKFTGSLPTSGLYFIKLTVRDRTYTKRLLVQ